MRRYSIFLPLLLLAGCGGNSGEDTDIETFETTRSAEFNGSATSIVSEDGKNYTATGGATVYEFGGDSGRLTVRIPAGTRRPVTLAFGANTALDATYAESGKTWRATSGTLVLPERDAAAEFDLDATLAPDLRASGNQAAGTVAFRGFGKTD